MIIATGRTIPLLYNYVDGNKHVAHTEAFLHLTLRQVNPLSAKLFNLNFHPLEVVSR